MLTSTIPYSRPLGNGLVMKSIADERDVERIAAFDIQIFGADVAEFAPALILHHPATRPEHWLYIEDETTKQIVSSLCLLPWEWCYEDVTLKSGEVGIVGTLESYRNRGLVRSLMARHHELLQEGGFDLSHIQGIPYYYRQFGYEYAIPLDVYLNIELRHLPDKASEMSYRFRLATQQDIPILMRLYEQAILGLDISAVRDASMWHYLLEYSIPTSTGAETWLILDAAEQAIAYFRVPFHAFGSGLVVNETSRMDSRAAKALFIHLKGLAQERGKSHIRLSLPESNDLVSAARPFNVKNDGHYPWQIHLVDVARLLRKLTPVIERRIAMSIFAGLTRTVCLNLYREAFELSFENGKLQTVKQIGFSDKSEIRIPPQAFVPLVLGYRSTEELRRMYPDFGVYGEMQYLIEVMFPQLDNFIFTIY